MVGTTGRPCQQDPMASGPAHGVLPAAIVTPAGSTIDRRTISPGAASRAAGPTAPSSRTSTRSTAGCCGRSSCAPAVRQLTERRDWVKTEREPLEPPPQARVPGGIPRGAGGNQTTLCAPSGALRHRCGNDGKPLRAVPGPGEAVASAPCSQARATTSRELAARSMALQPTRVSPRTAVRTVGGTALAPALCEPALRHAVHLHT